MTSALASLVLALALGAGQTARAGVQPVRMSAEIGGDHAVVEVRDLPAEAAQRAVEEALRTIAEAERLLSADEDGGAVRSLNEAAGAGPQTIGGDLGRMLQTALGFCLWIGDRLISTGISLPSRRRPVSSIPIPIGRSRGAPV